METDTQHGPSPDTLYPLGSTAGMVFLKNIVTNPNILVGDYTYYHDFVGDRLVIGKFCSIASNVRFIMNGGNHRTDWITNYPFPVFGNGWEKAMPDSWPNKGDTIIGNDVWIGYGATIMPGVHIGDGAIVATGSVVTSNVAPYAIVGGNPAKEIRKRFPDADIEKLLRIAWWNWDIETITEHLAGICGGDVACLSGIK